MIADAVDGKALLLISAILLEELAKAPDHVQTLLARLPEHAVERVEVTAESETLRDAYLEAGVVSRKWSGDAWHVALATISHADLIVSWNFKHLVNVVRIRGFNSVNLRLGYQTIDIRTPREVIADVAEDS